MNEEQIKEAAISLYGNDLHSYGQQRDGFAEGAKWMQEENSKWVLVDYKIPESLPEPYKPVLAEMEWSSGKIIYGVLIYVNDKDDHEWETADDNSELSNSLTVIGWKNIN